MSAQDWQAILLTVKLAGLTTLVLLLISPPLAWWLSRTQRKAKVLVEAVVALPLVLPPTVLGFYLLWAFSPNYFLGQWWQGITGQPLAFTFTGLWLASVIYSMPFVVQPLQAGFSAIGRGYHEAAATLGLGPIQRFFKITLPLTLPSFVIAAVLGFAHTVGEFGVVLMIGGSIPGETRVLSIALFEQVETLNFAAAHRLAGALLLFSLVTLLFMYALMHRRQRSVLL